MTQTWTGRSDLLVTMALLVPHQARLALVAAEPERKAPFADELPSRQEQLAALQNTEEFDVLVVGGGATGVGCALDAATRSEFPVNAGDMRSIGVEMDSSVDGVITFKRRHFTFSQAPACLLL